MLCTEEQRLKMITVFSPEAMQEDNGVLYLKY
jgi:hypothetical protein